MANIETVGTNSLHVTIGDKPMDLKVEGVFVRNGIDEIDAHIEHNIKPMLDEIIKSKSVELESSINLFNENVFLKTNEFNQNVEEQKNYITEMAKKWAIAPIEENEEGSAKYWAEQAKINFEESLNLVDAINNEEV